MPPATGGVEPTEDNIGYRQAISVPDGPPRVGIAVPGECARAMTAAGGRSAATMSPKTRKQRPRVLSHQLHNVRQVPVGKSGPCVWHSSPDVPRGTGAPHVQAMYRTVVLWCETKERSPDGGEKVELVTSVWLKWPGSFAWRCTPPSSPPSDTPWQLGVQRACPQRRGPHTRASACAAAVKEFEERCENVRVLSYGLVGCRDGLEGEADRK